MGFLLNDYSVLTLSCLGTLRVEIKTVIIVKRKDEIGMGKIAELSALFCMDKQSKFQNVIESIRDMMNIDVTMMDNNMIRIAGTGPYADLVNEKIENGTAFGNCLKDGRPFKILEDRYNNDICNNCPRKDSCAEKSLICVPINIEDETIGVIGLIAFNNQQRNILVDKKDLCTKLLRNISLLISTEFSNKLIERENIVLANRLDIVTRYLDQPLVIFSNTGHVLYESAAMKQKLDQLSGGYRHLKHIWSHLSVNQFADKGPDWILEKTVGLGNEKISLMAQLNKVRDMPEEIMVVLQDKSDGLFPDTTGQAGIDKQTTFDHIFGFSKEFEEVKRYAQKAALTGSNILITGETGTGKELFARAVHSASNRNKHPFVPINCSAIPENLFESELFGYEKGAFTGAEKMRVGKIEAAENGTLFLDEISEIPLNMQVKLLRVIQEKEVCRIGSNETRRVNVRIISATNSDLLDCVNRGTFRKDLFYRLNIIPLRLPPLRQRAEEIVAIAEYFMELYAKQFKKRLLGISEDAQKLLIAHKWPGNIRELENVMEFAVIYEEGALISKSTIAKRLRMDRQKQHDSTNDGTASLYSYLQNKEKGYIENMIAAHNRMGSSKTTITNYICRDLDISTATFYRKIKELNIEY